MIIQNALIFADTAATVTAHAACLTVADAFSKDNRTLTSNKQSITPINNRKRQ